MGFIRKAKASALIALAAGAMLLPGKKAEAQTMFGRFGYSAGAYYSQSTGEDPEKEIIAKFGLA